MGGFFVSSADLKARMDSGAPLVILDVRKRAAFEESGEMISGATWRDPFEIAAWIGEIDRDTPLIVYCVHGHEVSRNAAKALRDAGLDARVLEGGLEAWRQGGGVLLRASENTGSGR